MNELLLLVDDEPLTIGAEVLQLRDGVKALRQVHGELDLMISAQEKL